MNYYKFIINRQWELNEHTIREQFNLSECNQMKTGKLFPFFGKQSAAREVYHLKFKLKLG